MKTPDSATDIIVSCKTLEVKRHIQCCIDTEECILCSFFGEGCDKTTFAKLMLNAIQQLETDNEMLIGMLKIGDKATKWREEWADKQIANAESKIPKWISIAERQPELNEKTLVCVERPMFSIKTYFTVDTAFYIGNGVWQYKFEKRPHVTYRPKYWMPLPEPPKEDL